ncbi:G-box-binding factor 4 [Heracleum sosnowskyi]|uniref:G-box-binding factor 4 n=1 Tax=Heracleum sosnowskyi TaxID=360622 RepID=A0AAD8HS05_9APIA|nr:G-box-binding factor 4 [Heracleum sosnowskyi]
MVDSDLHPSSHPINLETDATDLTLSISGIFTSSSAPTSPPPRKTAEEVWGEIVAKKALKVEPNEDQELMTLEDFLAKADAKVEEREFVKVERLWSDAGVYGAIVSERSGVEEAGRRGKRRVESLDKVVMQRQRRMIKNRESAARSRERKQAYQVELESMVMKLEEENELLLKEKDARIKERLKELMEKIVPVVEKRKPQCALRRVHSGQW